MWHNNSLCRNLHLTGLCYFGLARAIILTDSRFCSFDEPARDD